MIRGAKMPTPAEHEDFWQWWQAHGEAKHGLMRWGDHHTAVAMDYAAYCSRRAVSRTLDEALNSGDGTYRP